MMKRIRTLLVAMCVLIAFPGLVKAEDMTDMTEMSLLRKAKQAIRQAKKKTKRARKNNKKKLKKKSRTHKKKKNISQHKKKRMSKNSRKKKTKKKAKKRTSKRFHKRKMRKGTSSRRAKGNKKRKNRKATSFDENYAAMMADFDANVAILKQDMTIFGDRATAEQFAPIFLRELGFVRAFCQYAIEQQHAAAIRHRTTLATILNDINSINNIHKMISVLKLERFRGSRNSYQNFVLLGNVIAWKLNDRNFRGLNGDRLLSRLLTESLNLMDRS